METFIKEYFNLTGRPIATMTVDEYIKFKSYFSNTNQGVEQFEFFKTPNKEQLVDTTKPQIEKTNIKTNIKEKGTESGLNSALKMLQSIDS